MPRSKKKAATKESRAKKAGGPAAEPTMSKAAFVRSLPRSMPAAEVIAKAAEVGITLNAETVYGSRAKAKMKRAKKSEASPKKATGKRSSRAGGRGGKKERVLELVAKHPNWTKKKIAETVGCAVNYVYSVLGESGQVGEAVKSNGVPASNGAVTAFYRAVKGIGGVAKAKELIANIEAFQNA